MINQGIVMLQGSRNIAIFTIISLFFIELLRTAWISDDAAITLRTVLNFLNGYGPNFNIDERVQAYTHPLWFIILSISTWILENVFSATFILSIVFSLFSLWLLLTKASSNFLSGILAAIGLLLSKSFVDFSTSGLENPLSHTLIISLFLIGLKSIEKKSFSLLTLYFTNCSAIYLTRPDLLLLAMPFTLYIVSQSSSKPGLLLKAFVIGALPTLTWTLFSLYYYGFPFPNTAYAKLSTGIPSSELITQGMLYFLDTIDRDPLTLFLIALGLGIGFKSSRLGSSLSLGIVLYLVYVTRIGGDFMAGRFFTAPLIVAAILISRNKFENLQFKILLIAISILGINNIQSTLLSDSSYENTMIKSSGIADERGFYYQKRGLLTAERNTFSMPTWDISNRKIISDYTMGYNGIIGGPSTHLIDFCALADPLLARLPATRNPNWRVGHYVRQLPTGYEISILQGKNLLTDPKTHSYYESIRTITREKLNDYSRLKIIILFNLGMVQKPDQAMYQSKIIPENSRAKLVLYSDINNIVSSGSWDNPGNIQFSNILEIVFPEILSISTLDLSLDHNDHYNIEILSEEGYATIADIKPTKVAGMKRHQIILDKPVIAKKARIVVINGDGKYSLGHFIAK